MDFADFLRDRRDAIVSIRDGGRLIGSGVRIGNDEILTAAHVVAGRDAVNVAVKGVGLSFGTVSGYDTDRDVALISFEGSKDGTRATFSGEQVTLDTSSGNYYRRWDVGAEVAVIGFAPSVSDTTPVATFGRIGVTWNIVPGDYSQGQTDAAVTAGMSGGGVFNIHGDFIGIILSSSNAFDGNTRFLLVSEINEVIGQLRSGPKR